MRQALYFIYFISIQIEWYYRLNNIVQTPQSSQLSGHLTWHNHNIITDLTEYAGSLNPYVPCIIQLTADKLLVIRRETVIIFRIR